jgi:hypothetical protein
MGRVLAAISKLRKDFDASQGVNIICVRHIEALVSQILTGEGTSHNIRKRWEGT